jgi:hypothetical protein
MIPGFTGISLNGWRVFTWKRKRIRRKILMNTNRIACRCIITILILSLLSIVFILKSIESLNWRMEHDAPLLHYAAFMMDRHQAVPYRDMFETSMPGTFMFHYAIGKVFGYNDAAFQAVNIILLLGVMLLTYMGMRRFGWASAWTATVVFGLMYLAFGRMMTLQRDYLGIMPVAMALVLIPETGSTRPGRTRFFITGILFGIASTIKPHLVIAAPAIGYGLWKTRRLNGNGTVAYSGQPGDRPPNTGKDTAAVAGIMILGIITAWLPIAIWLIVNGAWNDFLSISLIYLPLHSAVTGTHQVLTGWTRVWYIVESTLKFGGFGPLILAGLFGLYRVLYVKNLRNTRKVMSRVILSCAILYSLYPVFAGKFWPYHYMPMVYFLICAAALALADQTDRSLPDSGGTDDRIPLKTVCPTGYACSMVIVWLAFTIQLHLPGMIKTTFENTGGKITEAPPKSGRVDQIAAWLALHAHPDDTVQPLDWTGGAIHGMLIAKTPLATRFLYDYHFFHHVSHPYIQGLRREFIRSLHEKQPRFIIEVETDQPRISGRDTSSDFPALKAFITSRYNLAFYGDGFAILERKTDPGLFTRND